MMRLAERLRRLDRRGDRFVPRHAPEAERQPLLAGPGVLPAGKLLPMPSGSTYVREVSVPLALRHGEVPLADIARIRSAGLSLLAHDLDVPPCEPSDILFLDIETTGLMSGAGLLVFLVGVGYVDGDRIVVEQHFLRDPADERAFLEGILERWRRFGVIATYNGRQFDQPRLRDRLRYHRMDDRPPHRHHLDLFLLARRVWRERFSSLSLRDVEVQVLGHERKDDLPGYLCPAAYAEYLRGEGGMIAGVFRHNLEDVISLAALSIRLARVGDDPRGPFEEAAVATGLDRSGRTAEAFPLYESAFRELPPGGVRRRVGRRLAAAYRDMRQWNRSVEIWRRLCKEGDLRAARALAIALEHHLGDTKGAERVTLAALRTLDAGEGVGGRSAWFRRDWERRLFRLRRKRAGDHRKSRSTNDA